MKVRIHIENIDEVVEGADAAVVLHQVKQEAARRAPLLVRGVLKGMSDMGFAAEAVKHANKTQGRSDPPPASAREFLAWAVKRGYATILDS